MESQLKILGESPRTSRGTRVVAECSCGIVKAYQKCHIRSRHTISCGCVNRSKAIKHGMHGTRVYETWHNMIQRCTNSRSTNWHRYGGRGINVCERWKDFASFYIDMGDRPEGKELDRIDNNKGYSPDNCRWSTRKENSNNKGNSIKIELGYIQLSLVELAKLGAVSYDTMRHRRCKYGNAWDCLFPPS